MPKGGARPGSGRKKGGTNAKRREFTSKVAETGLTPLDYLISIYRDETVPRDERIDAAKSAAPYVHSKMPTAIVTPPKANAQLGDDDERILDLYMSGLHDGADEE